MSADSFCPRLAAHTRHQIDRLTGAPMLLHPEGAVELSETADAIVQLCDGTRTVEAITMMLAAEYDAAPDALQSDVLACIAGLIDRGLLA